MATNDSFEIPRLNVTGSIPMAEVDIRANNPEAAAAARARIAAIMNGPLADIHPTASAPVRDIELITDRQLLAKRLQKPTKKRAVPSALQPFLTAIGAFALLLLAFKAPIIINQIKYATAPPEVISALPAAGSVIPAESSINIPKINVHAPLVDVAGRNEADVQKGLESGVIHYDSTPEPGQAGNSVFFGHSSNDWWEPGNFKFVFVLLDKLAIGDQFTIDYQSQRYTYEVTSTTVVEPNNLSVLAPTAEPTVTVITCTPPGTSWKRLVVTAKQISPSPIAAKAGAATPAAASSAASLPNGKPGFFTQVGDAATGLYHGILSLFGADQKSGSTDSAQTLPTVK
jgi:LPXTG-site transpeptidase (sortase) family protein